jgi:hypothetical protein
MNKAYFLIALFLITACGEKSKEESVDFLESQPSEIKNSYTFNKKYQGSYIDPKDSSQLLILPNKIIKTVCLRGVCLRNDLDSSFKGDKNNNDDVIASLKKDNIDVAYIDGDSIHFVWNIRDTLFSISPNNIAKYYKGSYFLNYTNDQLTWKVQRMDLSKKRLSIGMLMPNDSLFTAIQIKNISEIKNDTGLVVNYKMKPSKKELKKMVKAELFKESDVWLKVK